MWNINCRKQKNRGFSIIEVVITVVVAGILSAIAVPAGLSIVEKLRSGGDVRSLGSTVSLAKMRAAANFTNARVYTDLSTGAYRVEVWNKAGSWDTEGGNQSLSSNVSFGFGSLGSPPPNTQASIAQAPACLDNSSGTIANTACIFFNSRGVPVDSTGSSVGSGALYITDPSSVHGVTVRATGVIQTWRTDVATANWKRR